MTFGEMLSAVYDDLGYGSSPSPDQVTRIKRWINEGYRHLMGQPGMEQLRDSTFTVTTVAGEATLALPQSVNAIYRVTQTANSMRLRMMTRDAYRTVNPGLNQNTAAPSDAYVPWGWFPVLRHPNSTGVWAVSSSASDTTQTISMNANRANGDIAAVVNTAGPLTGTTRVQVGTLTDYTQITSLNLSAVAVGTVTFYDAAVGGNVLLRLQPGFTSAQYLHVAFFPTPSAATDYLFDVQLQIESMTHNSDIPLIPPDFHDLLPLYARMRDYVRAGADPRLPEAKQEWARRTAELKFTVQFPSDYQPVAGNQVAGYGWNNLGPNFPADIRF